MMRTTLTLDDDVAAKLKSDARKTGRPFKTLVNETLRDGFALREARRKQPPYRVKARPMGLRPGLSLDSISALIEQAEGPFHR